MLQKHVAKTQPIIFIVLILVQIKGAIQRRLLLLIKNVAKRMDSIGAMVFVISLREVQLLKTVVNKMDLYGVLIMSERNVILEIPSLKVNNAVKIITCFGAIIPVLTSSIHKLVVNLIITHGVLTDLQSFSVI